MPEAIAVTSGDLDTAARTLWGEARGEGTPGKQGVAWVYRRRLETAFKGAHSLEMVCLAHKQFSCWNEDDINRPKLLALPADSQEYRDCFEVVRAVMAGEVEDPTNGANHYERTGADAYWTLNADGSRIPPTAVIGHHSFYNVA